MEIPICRACRARVRPNHPPARVTGSAGLQVTVSFANAEYAELVNLDNANRFPGPAAARPVG